MRPLLCHIALSLFTVVVVVGCGGADQRQGGESTASEPSPGASSGSAGGSGSRVTIEGNEALRWGNGGYGVVLAHGAAFDAASWQQQATSIANRGATVVAVEDISPGAIADAVGYLRDDGIDDVALVGGSAGSDAILDLATQQPDLPDQLVLLSPNSTVEGLGEEPKLFIASEDEPVADVSTELARSAPGKDNDAMLVPGSAHAQNVFDTEQGPAVLDAMLQRLERFGL